MENVCAPLRQPDQSNQLRVLGVKNQKLWYKGSQIYLNSRCSHATKSMLKFWELRTPLRVFCVELLKFHMIGSKPFYFLLGLMFLFVVHVPSTETTVPGTSTTRAHHLVCMQSYVPSGSLLPAYNTTGSGVSQAHHAPPDAWGALLTPKKCTKTGYNSGYIGIMPLFLALSVILYPWSWYSFFQGKYQVGDAAYSVSEKMLVPFTGSQRNNANNDAYNFCLSQLRIRIEMAFGLMSNKWRILRTPLQTSLKTSARILECCSKLHNFCINHDGDQFMDKTVAFREILPMPGADLGWGSLPTVEPLVSIPGTSQMRESIVRRVGNLAIRRPAENLERHRYELQDINLM